MLCRLATAVRRAVLVAALLSASGQACTAQPAEISGHPALMLAALTGAMSPELTANQKAALAALADGRTPISSTDPIKLQVGRIDCQTGNVDIASASCELAFGQMRVRLTGRQAALLFAVMGDAGAARDAGAGHVMRNMQSVACVISPASIAAKDGSGAACSVRLAS